VNTQSSRDHWIPGWWAGCGWRPADAAIDQLRAKIGSEKLESWLISSTGRLLAVVTNTQRAMVMLLDGEGDEGDHAVDPGADGYSDGCVLANGQSYEYPNEDTVPLQDALWIVRHILTQGDPPADGAWRVDH